MNYIKNIVTVLLAVAVVACGLEDDTSFKVNKRHESADIMAIAGLNGCTGCHQIKQSLIGPPWDRISDRYANVDGARQILIDKVKYGSKGSWTDSTGGAAMPPNSPRVSDAHIEKLVDFILSINANQQRLTLRPK